METLKKNPSVRRKGKLARTFQKVCNLRTTSTKVSANNGIGGICLPKSHHKPNLEDDDDGDCDSVFDLKSTTSNSSRSGELKVREQRRRAVFEAVVAKIFASTTSIKAAYAELQMAQRPYDNAAIQAADTAVVEELRALSELKRSFLRKELNISPQVAVMLAEIQEQQSLMRTYEITIKKLESESAEKESKIDSLRKSLEEVTAVNRSIEKKLTASGSVSPLDNVVFSNLNLSGYVQILGFTLRSVRSFVKSMVKEMESASWDLDAAASASAALRNASTVFSRPSHRCFAFESFVCCKMLENFESSDFSLPNVEEKPSRERFFNLRSVNPVQYLTRNPGSSFAKFVLHKYLSVVHAKMECSFFGNLNQRKLVNSGGFPDSGFFAAFCEMAKRIWLLHCLAFCMSENVTVFQIKKGCRFSQVYMESVKSGDESLLSSSNDNADIRVGFTVVPGFKIGDNVIQSQVYLSPATGFTQLNSK